MRVIGLLNWFDENPAWLAECAASASKLCDHVIAVDGPYAGFPGALKKPSSGSDQVDAITHTAAGLGMGCTIYSPRQVWWGPDGGEVAKRDFMFKLGMTFAEPDDWFLRIDADEILSDVPLDTRMRLGGTEHNVAEVTIWEREASQHVANMAGDYQSPFRCLYRALPGIRIEQAHFIVTAPVDGERVFLNGPHAAPAETLWDVRLEHRTRLRTAHRQQLKSQYNDLINTFEKVEDVPRES